jgi:mannose-6-phosphate isomerase
LREKIWGSRDLEPWHARQDRDIGEIWFLPECELPILVKLVYTSARLSVQVHPDDLDGEPGKTEMWYVLRAEPGAQLGLGFREPISRERLREASLSGEIESLMRWFPVKAGEAYFAPSHTVHTIGAGLVLCEIQQNCDTTYRLYDYGRPRQLHLDKACCIANTGLHPGAAVPLPLSERESLLVSCPYFAAESVWFCGETRYGWQPDRFHLLICTEGRGHFDELPFAAGEAWLVPPGTPEFRIRAEGTTHFLRTYVPAASAKAT